MGPKVRIKVSHDGMILVQINGEEGWNVFHPEESLKIAHEVIAGQTERPTTQVDVWAVAPEG